MIDINTLYTIIFNATKTLTCPTTGLAGIALDLISGSRYSSDDKLGYIDMTKITFNVALSDLDHREVLHKIAASIDTYFVNTPYSLKTLHLDSPSRLTYNARRGEVRSSKGETTLTIHIKG